MGGAEYIMSNSIGKRALKWPMSWTSLQLNWIDRGGEGVDLRKGRRLFICLKIIKTDENQQQPEHTHEPGRGRVPILLKL